MFLKFILIAAGVVDEG